MSGNGWEDLALEIHKIATEKGFWEYDEVDFTVIAYKLAMIHSEVTEVLEAVRKSQGTDVVLEELADIVIRLLDLYIGLKESGDLHETQFLKTAVMEKVAKNRARPIRHGTRG